MSLHHVLINAQDYTHIRITKSHEIDYWTRRFNVTETELVELVATHGSAVATIIRVLGAGARVSAEYPAGKA